MEITDGPCGRRTPLQRHGKGRCIELIFELGCCPPGDRQDEPGVALHHTIGVEILKGAAIHVAKGFEHVVAAHLLEIGHHGRLDLKLNGDALQQRNLDLIQPRLQKSLHGEHLHHLLAPTPLSSCVIALSPAGRCGGWRSLRARRRVHLMPRRPQARPQR